jgi:hypothetical protein
MFKSFWKNLKEILTISGQAQGPLAAEYTPVDPQLVTPPAPPAPPKPQAKSKPNKAPAASDKPQVKSKPSKAPTAPEAAAKPKKTRARRRPAQ